MNKLEFYLDGANKNIVVYDISLGDHKILEVSDTDIINPVINLIKEYYPLAFDRLMELHKGSEFKFRAISHFIRCNFYLNDRHPDIDEFGMFILEEVPCPLKNSSLCDNYNIICNPKMTTEISSREKDIAVLLADGFSPEQVADKLFISPHTVCNHRRNIYKKLSIHSVSDLLRYCIKHNWL